MKTLLTTGLVALSVLATALSPAEVSARPYDRSVEVINEGRNTVFSIDVSNVHDPYWGPDELRNFVIHPGQSRQIQPRNHNGYCRFDLRVTFTSSREINIWDVNMCEARYIYVDEYGWDIY